MAVEDDEVGAPLVFQIVATDDSDLPFTWQLFSRERDTVMADGVACPRRADVRKTINLISRHAAHARLEDLT